MTATANRDHVEDVAERNPRREHLLRLVKRFLACIAGSLVLALMVGKQQGSDQDYGLAFHEAILDKRVFIFLGLGIIAFVVITYGARLLPYLKRPGAPALLSGAVVVVGAYTLLKWYDAVPSGGDGKLSSVGDAVADTPAISFPASAFFAWLQWTGLIVVVVVGLAAVVTEIKPLAWVAAAISVAMGIVAIVAKQQVVDFANGIDHSLGSYFAFVGFAVMAFALGSAAVSNEQVAATRASIDRVMGLRPGAPIAGVGIVAGLCAFTFATWFSPARLNANFSDTQSLFDGSGVQELALTYVNWLGWVLFGVTAALVLVAAFSPLRSLGFAGLAVGLAGVVLTLITLYQLSDFGAALGVDSATGPWQNLGVGGWIASLAFVLLAGGGYFAATVPRGDRGAVAPSVQLDPATQGSLPQRLLQRVRERPAGSPATRNLFLFAIAAALFLPPTMTSFWQNVLVSEIGVYVLLAVGLNVVVGWAGLLDLGYIAFFALGSYTTAYLTGSLPIKPPSWLDMPSLVAIPFAIAVCLIAGVLLGAPTLRLRGDYLAIVTLGFGEIIRLVANNAEGVTGGPSGVRPQVPHPSIHLGPIDLTWSLNSLQYWYLLLVILVIVIIAFHRLEGSRLGRAWSAIREDEVAAQATGINTTKVKLLAFAIGASTSGVAGVFFASQVGYFNPDNFLLVNSILVVAYVVFGGMGSLPGAMAGAAVLTWLPEFLRDQVPEADRQMWIGFVLLLMMIFRPAGLFPAKRRKAELSGLEQDVQPSERTVAPSEGL